jgi:hypothetical protein
MKMPKSDIAKACQLVLASILAYSCISKLFHSFIIKFNKGEVENWENISMCLEQGVTRKINCYFVVCKSGSNKYEFNYFHKNNYGRCHVHYPVPPSVPAKTSRPKKA